MTLEIRGLESGWPGFPLGPIEAEVPAGATLAVVGPSGAGKTTLLRTLAGFLPARAGSVWLDGRALDRLPPERRGIGYVPQGLGLFPHRSVAGNIRFPIELRGSADGAERAEALLERFGLASKADRSVRTLSGGERQRVALARALAASPRLLLWDEPLSAVDVEARRDLLDVLSEALASERLPLVLVTHDAATVSELTDRLLVLEGGRSAFCGRAEELLRRPVSRFTARFLGYENVYDSEELGAEAAEPFPVWLRAFAGPEGIAFGADAIALAPEGGGQGLLRVRRRALTAGGTVISGRVGRLPLVARLPPAGTPGAGPEPGTAVAFSVTTEALRPLGGSPRRA